MNPPCTDLSSFRADMLDQSALGRACGSQRLFRDRYRVLRVIGRGGFGVTFLARDVYLPYHPYCVIKQLRPKVNDPTTLQRAVKRFEREAETLSKLGSHAQIPQLLDYFEINGEFFLVQEYIQGMTLAREIRRFGVRSEAAVKQFLRELLPLLGYIHRHKVIHRDIKPQNLIRCSDGRLVLIDFGAVKEQIAHIEDSSQKAPTTHFIGTVGFAPPEQLSMRPVYASDIYAVGVTCLYLLTGKSPLDFEYDPETGDIAWQDEVKVSDHFAKVLNKMLRNSPRERYQTADELLRALNLEPYLESLAPCLNVQASQSHQSSLNSGATDSDGYQSPIVRTAIAIREWKAKLQNKEAAAKRHLVPIGAMHRPNPNHPRR